jgi:hypothetical protein
MVGAAGAVVGATGAMVGSAGAGVACWPHAVSSMATVSNRLKNWIERFIFFSFEITYFYFDVTKLLTNKLHALHALLMLLGNLLTHHLL